MRCFLVILDGLGDRACRALGGRTPLEAAHTPNMDRLAAMGMNGLYHPSLQGEALPSELAHFLIFGYERSEFPGRGILEAVGYGVDVSPDEVAVLAHFCEVREEGGRLVLLRERADVEDSLLPPLGETIGAFETRGVGIRFLPTKGVEGILVLSGAVTPSVTDSDPMLEGLPLVRVEPTEGTEKAENTARALREYLRWAYRRLSSHPMNVERSKRGLPLANGVVTQRPGRWRALTAFREKWGLRGLSLSSGAVYWGLCDLLGIRVERVEDSGDPEKDLAERLRRALGFTDADFVHVHTKMPDEAGHAKDPKHKKSVIEALDRAMAFALERIAPDPENLLVVTSDHSTPSVGTLVHSGETVPLAIVGRYVRRDGVSAFGEVEAARGALGIVRGPELILLILNFMDRAKLTGLRDSPVDRPYYPADRRALDLDGD